MRFLVVLIANFWAFSLTLALEPKKEAPITRLPDGRHAYALAWADLQSFTPTDAFYLRYLFIPDFTPEKLKATTLGINYVSRASVPLRLNPLTSGFLVRVDLRKFAPAEADVKTWIDLWEEFRFDPAFNLLITRDLFESILSLPEQHQPAARIRRGQKFEEVPFKTLNLTTVDVVRLVSPSLDPQTVALVQEATASAAPIVEYRYFLTRLLSTVQDQGVFKTIYGGLYYEFAGIPQSNQNKVTDEDLLFRQIGIGSEQETAAQFLDRLKGDQRTAAFRSDVTGKPRWTDFFATSVRRPGDGVSVASITHDLRDQDIDVGQHPVMNLLQFRDAAREMIYTRSNGMPGYALFNGQGKLQRFVPPDVAADRTISAPHTPILQSAISCISCHEASGDDGWKPLTNDVKTLLKVTDVFDDRNRGKQSVAETLDRVGGLYLGDPAKFLRRARDDYAETVLRVTGPWRDAAKSAQTTVVKSAAKELVGIVHSYKYNQINAQAALAELGFVVPKDKALLFWKAILPPDTRSLFHGVIPEDARIAALSAGLAINRAEWDLVRQFAASRVAHTLDLFRNQGR